MFFFCCCCCFPHEILQTLFQPAAVSVTPAEKESPLCFARSTERRAFIGYKRAYKKRESFQIKIQFENKQSLFSKTVPPFAICSASNMAFSGEEDKKRRMRSCWEQDVFTYWYETIFIWNWKNSDTGMKNLKTWTCTVLFILFIHNINIQWWESCKM